MANPQENAIGVPIAATLKNPDGTTRNIANATVHNFLFRKPDGECVTRTADFVNDGSDGKLIYTTIAGDLSPAGRWRLQAEIVQPGYEGFSEIGYFWVQGNLPDPVAVA